MFNVTKSFEKTAVLQDFSLTFEKGQIVSLLAPSGHGKTTILHLISDITHPDKGIIKVHTSKIGYIFQEHRLIPWKTVLQNLLFVMNDISRKERKTRALDILQQVGLDHVTDFYPSQLSGGMKQRVSIARAFAYQPELILMDEPFSALDVKRKEKLQHALIDLIETYKQTIIYVTHDPLEAAKISDKVLILKSNHTNELPIKDYMTLTIDKPKEARDDFFTHSTAKTIISMLKGEY